MNTYNNITAFRRVKERLVGEAIDKVDMWRRMFEYGIEDDNGEVQRVTLNKAAELVGIPKKTLEDYSQLFKKVKLIADPLQFSEKKMGFLRNFLRKNQSKLKKALKLQILQESEDKKSVQSVKTEKTQDVPSCFEIYSEFPNTEVPELMESEEYSSQNNIFGLSSMRMQTHGEEYFSCEYLT